MTLSCGWDIGANGVSECQVSCLTSGCVGISLGDGVCDEACNRAECGWDFGDCGVCAPGCTSTLLENAVCDAECNTANCEYDRSLCISEGNPAVLYVTATGTGGNLGSKEDPKWSLSDALAEVSYQWTQIWMLRGTHLFLPTSGTGDLRPLSNKRTNVMIGTLFCAVLSHSECALTSATVRLGDHTVGLDASLSLRISDIVWDGGLSVRPGCDQCSYCPYTIQSGSSLLDDRGASLDPSNVATQTWCDPFTTLKFIRVNGGNLTLKKVVFQNFRQQFAAIISSEEGNLSLSNTDFKNIQVEMAGLTSAVISQSVCAKPPYGCGSFSYTTGTVSLLNNGYEDRASLSLSGFLVGFGYSSVLISNVTFSYNFVQVGSASSKSRASLLYFSNLRTLTVNNCVFEYTITKSAIIQLDSNFVIPQIVSNGKLVDHELYHVQITDCTFRANTVGTGGIAIAYSLDMQNIRIANTTFSKNLGIADCAVLILGPALTPELQSGLFKAIPVNGVPTNVFFPPRNISIFNCTIADNDSVGSAVFKLSSVPNIVYDTVFVSNNGNSKSNVYPPSFTFPYYVSNPESYIKKIPASTQAISRTYCVYFLSSGTLYFMNSSILNNTSYSGAVLGNGLTAAFIHDLLFIGNAIISPLASGLTVISTAAYIEVYNLRFVGNNSPAGQGALILLAKIINAVYSLRDCYFQDNASLRSGALYVGDSSKASLTNVTFIRNSAMQTGGAITYRVKAGASTGAIIITNCLFVENSVGLSGIIHMENTLTGVTVALVSISDTVFRGNTADHGSSLFLGSEIWLNPASKFSNCTFVGNKSLRDGIVYLAYSSGMMTIDACRFERNAANQGSAVYLGHFSLPAVARITNCYFASHTGNNGVLTVPSTMQTPTIETANNQFLNNANQGVKITSGRWIDTGSVFINNTAIQGGAVALLSQSYANLTSTLFAKNSASNYGGAVSIFDSSTLECRNCTAKGNNCGIKGAVAYAFNNSTMSLSNCQVEENASNGQGSVFYMSGSLRASVITNSTFQKNSAGDFGMIVLYEASIRISTSIITQNSAEKLTAGIHAVMSNITLSASHISKQSGMYGGFIYASQYSKIDISDSEFENITAVKEGGIASISQSVELTITGSIFTYISADSGGIVNADKDSIVQISHSSVSQSSTFVDSLFRVDLGTLALESTEFQSIFGGVGFGIGLARLTITNCDFRNVTSLLGTVRCENCDSVSVSDSNFVGGVGAENGAGAMFVSRADAEIIVERSKFYHNSAIKGGGLYISEGSANVSECHFEGNSAMMQGGAIALICSLKSDCGFTVRSSCFEGNSARISGGAIHWSVAQPNLTDNVFAGNSAEYGSNFSSFPITLGLSTASRRLENTVNLTLSSGQIEKRPLKIALLDHYKQVVVTDNSSIVELEAADPTTVVVSGATRLQAFKGIAVFSNYRVTAMPGKTIELTIVCESVSTPVRIQAYMRLCEIGEFDRDGECEVCQYGYYSLDPSMECTRCPETADCFGNYTLVPVSGYWRSSNLTNRIMKCPNVNACVGSQNVSNLSLTGLCADGYFGNLCDGCIQGYFRSGANQCSECPDETVNNAMFAFLSLLLVLIAAAMIYTAIRSANKPKSVLSIYIKIFMNYLQLVLACSSVDLNYPRELIEISNAQGKVGNFGEQLFSVDCYFETPDSVESLESKLLLLTIGPVIFIVASALFWLGVKLVLRRHPMVFSKAVVSMIVLIFLMHPTLTRVMLSQFHCQTIDPGEEWLVNNLNIRCWEGSHKRLALTVALPSVIVWVVGLPAVTLIYLLAYKQMLGSPEARMKFGFLINGYKPNRFFWEFVIVYRKVLVISLAVFMSNVSISIQALALMTVMICVFALQNALTPYFNDRLNSLEKAGILVSAVTIYSGMYFISPDLNYTGVLILFSVIVLSNAYFLASWLTAVSGSTLILLISRCRWLRNARLNRVVALAERMERGRSSIVTQLEKQSQVGEVGKGEMAEYEGDEDPKAPAHSFDESFG